MQKAAQHRVGWGGWPDESALRVLPGHVRVVVERRQNSVHARILVLVRGRRVRPITHAEQHTTAQPIAIVGGEHAGEEAGAAVLHGNDL